MELLPPGAEVLEVGSGPGLHARHLEGRGLRVRRTDGARAFVERLRAQGYPADVLDVRSDELPGPPPLRAVHARGGVPVLATRRAGLLEKLVDELPGALPVAVDVAAPDGPAAMVATPAEVGRAESRRPPSCAPAST